MNRTSTGGAAPLLPAGWPGNAVLIHSILAILLMMGWGVAGCASQKLGPSGGGFATEDAAAVSAVVAQTRAQFPKLSATGVKYVTRVVPRESQRQKVQLVLKGVGAGVSPGIQVAAQVPMEFELFLNKPGYDQGYGRLAVGRGEKETWRIVAHDHRGHAGGEFEFIYLLSSSNGELWYLAVIGGEFEQGGEAFRGVEGTLIVPGEGGQVSKWKRAFKIDFGSRMPVAPAFQKMVNEAQRQFKSLRRRLPGMEAQRKRIDRSRAQLDLLLNVPDARQATGGSGKNAAAAREKARLDDLQAQRTQQAAESGRELVEYFRLRERIAGAYAEFVRGNAYTWALQPRQQRFYDAWKEVELHHPEIDEITTRVLAYLPEPSAVKRAQARAMAAAKRQGNWGKDPARQRDNKK